MFFLREIYTNVENSTMFVAKKKNLKNIFFTVHKLKFRDYMSLNYGHSVELKKSPKNVELSNKIKL